MMNKARGQRRRMAKAYLCHQIHMHMMYKQVLKEQEELADRISVNINSNIKQMLFCYLRMLLVGGINSGFSRIEFKKLE
jgi:hypothetical protein